MDFKMNFENSFYRKSSLEFFGKPGISWHCSVVRFRIENEDDESGEERGTLVSDHSASEDSPQHVWAVISVLNSVLARLQL